MEYAGLWLNQVYVDSTEHKTYNLVYSKPKNFFLYREIPKDHPIIQLTKDQKFVIFRDHQKEFKEVITERNITSGTIAIINLGELGFLKLYTSSRKSVLTKKDLSKLYKVINSFAVSLRMCLYNQRFKQEVFERVKTEQHYQILFFQNPNPMLIYSLNSKKILSVNQALVQSYGYSKKELLNMKISQLRDPASNLEVDKRLNDIKKGKSLKIETTHILKNDRRIQVSIHAKLIDFKGQEAALELLQDITEIKANELEIRKLAKFPDENPFPVLRVSQEGVLLYANKAVGPILKLWNIKAGQTLPTRIFHKVTFSSNPFFKEIKVLVDDRIYSLIFNFEENAGYYNVYGSDITKTKKVERALKESEAKTRSIIKSALDAVILIDNESKVTEWNMMAEAIFGWPKDEAIGQKLGKLIIPERYVDAHNAGMEKFLETGEGPVLNQRIEIQARRKNGTELPVELAVNQVIIRGNIYFSAFIRDISKRKEAEKQIKLLKKWINQVSDAVLVSDRDGNFVFVNEEAAHRLGYTQEELLKLNFQHVENTNTASLTWLIHFFKSL
ncbi:MAG: PAS domain S-box protein, partial [Bacteroidota bacterium]